MKFEVYVLKFNGTEKKYIGVTRAGAYERFKDHRKLSRDGKTHLYRAWREFGEPSLEILHTLQDGDAARSMEQELILNERTFHPFGFNSTLGGESGTNTLQEVSEDTKRRISESIRKCWEDPDIRQRMKDGFKKRPPGSWNKGKKTSEETRRKQSEARRGTTLSEETKAKIGASGRGRRHTDETRKKISAAHLRKRFDAAIKSAQEGW